LNSHHNVHFYLDTMRKIREAIEFGNLAFYLDTMRKIREAIEFGNLAGFRADLQARLEHRHSELGV